jgi:DNA (cytosine-5)-methyltransferase 1
MRELALFAGAGGGILGGHLLGWRCVCAVEIDPFCREVLLRRQMDGFLPRFPIWDDVRTFDGRPWRGCVDVITAGFPCQPFSSAARGRLVAENLWPEVIRIANEVQPSAVFAENVLHSGMPGATISASDVGAPHIRKRRWSICHADGDRESVLQVDAKVARVQAPDDGVWGVDPRGVRVSDGVANRVDRLGAVGNGQVPAVAALAWNILTDIRS